MRRRKPDFPCCDCGCPSLLRSATRPRARRVIVALQRDLVLCRVRSERSHCVCDIRLPGAGASGPSVRANLEGGADRFRSFSQLCIAASCLLSGTWAGRTGGRAVDATARNDQLAVVSAHHRLVRRTEMPAAGSLRGAKLRTRERDHGRPRHHDDQHAGDKLHRTTRPCHRGLPGFPDRPDRWCERRLRRSSLTAASSHGAGGNTSSSARRNSILRLARYPRCSFMRCATHSCHVEPGPPRHGRWSRL